jgi:hypothetical protein
MVRSKHFDHLAPIPPLRLVCVYLLVLTEGAHGLREEAGSYVQATESAGSDGHGRCMHRCHAGSAMPTATGCRDCQHRFSSPGPRTGGAGHVDMAMDGLRTGCLTDSSDAADLVAVP